jgi:probable F420-dependent oxidoreductase
MPSRVEVGVSLSMHPPEVQWALVRRVEELGFDSIWTGDHVSFYLPMYESLTLLASYASVVRRIKLGTAVYLLALRHPTVVAKITSTLDVLAGGRLVLGVGVGGENAKEFEACGVPLGERGARVDEGIDVLRALWTGTPATFKGRFTAFEAVSIDPKPVQPKGPPIWIGGRSDIALRRAARRGQGWVSYVVTPDRYRQSLEKIAAAAAEGGRSLDGFVRAHLAFITVGRDFETARSAWVTRLSARYNQDFSRLADKYGVIGTPAQCLEALQRLADAGCRYFILNPIGDPRDDGEQLERIAADVLPRLATRVER